MFAAVLQLVGLAGALVAGWMLGEWGGLAAAASVDAVFVGLALEQRGGS